MAINRATFYKRYRKVYGRVRGSQLPGFEACFDFWDSRTYLTDSRWLAYVLATAFHETRRRPMQPVRECFCRTDACSIRCVTRMFRRGKIRENYAIPHPNGKSYFGRGLVQLTHDYNYITLGRALGLGRQLYNHPDLALRLDIAVQVLFVGMIEGLFTGKRLSQYFNQRRTDWKNARRIVNGLDQWRKIKTIALNMHSFIEFQPDINSSNEEELLNMLESDQQIEEELWRLDLDALRRYTEHIPPGASDYAFPDSDTPAPDEEMLNDLRREEDEPIEDDDEPF